MNIRKFITPSKKFFKKEKLSKSYKRQMWKHIIRSENEYLKREQMRSIF